MASKNTAGKLGLIPIVIAGSVVATAALSIAATVYVMGGKQPALHNLRIAIPVKKLDARTSEFDLAEQAVKTWTLTMPESERALQSDDDLNITSPGFSFIAKACSSNKKWRDLTPADQFPVMWLSQAKSAAGEFIVAQIWDRKSVTDYYLAVPLSGRDCAIMHRAKNDLTDLETDSIQAGAAVLGFAALTAMLGMSPVNHQLDDESRQYAAGRLNGWRNRWTIDVTPAPDQQASAASGPLRISTQDFDQLVNGETKEGVRQKLGSPSNVSEQKYDQRQNWYYRTDKVQLFDPDAGTNVMGSASVTFSTVTGRVIDTGY
jgi:hypothetical protein